MSDTENMNPLSKGRAVAGFGKTNTLLWIGVSLVIHTALIGGTSVPYIMDRWIDPEAAVARKAAAEAAVAKKKADEKAARANAEKPAPSTPGGASTAAAAQASKLTPEEAAKAGTPVMKRITDTAKPSELPTKPDDLGLSIDETNKNGK